MPWAMPRPEPATRRVPGCRRALPALRASALGAWPGWSLSRGRLRAGRKPGPEPAEEPARACQDPGRARIRQTDRSSSSEGARAHAAKTAKPAAHAASRDLRDRQARRRTSASKNADAALTRTLITQCGQPAGGSRACNRLIGRLAGMWRGRHRPLRCGCSVLPMPDEAPTDARLLVHVLRAVLMAAWMSGRMPRRVPLCVWLGRLRL